MIELTRDFLGPNYLLTAVGSGADKQGPFVALINGFSPEWRYERQFIGHRVGVEESSAIEIRCRIPHDDWTRKPQLLEIRGEPEERGFYVLHGNRGQIALSPIEEPTLIELLDARKLLTVIPEEYLPPQRTADTLAELRARVQSRTSLLPPLAPPLIAESAYESAMRVQQMQNELRQFIESTVPASPLENRHQRRAKAKQEQKEKAPVLKLNQVRKINFDDGE